MVSASLTLCLTTRTASLTHTRACGAPPRPCPAHARDTRGPLTRDPTRTERERERERDVCYMYLKRNVPELGDRAGRGRGHIVQRLEGLGRSKLPVWVHLLHGCLRGVDILRHGRAYRSVGRRGAATGWRAHLQTARLLECAERLVEAPRVLHLTHTRATQIAQSARTEARRRGRARGGGCGGCGGCGAPTRLLDARAQPCSSRARSCTSATPRARTRWGTGC